MYSQTKLFVLSDPPIASVFSDERRPTGEITPHMRAMMDDLGLSAETVGSSSIFTGDEEVFAFARAVVRCALLRPRLESLDDGMLTHLHCPRFPTFLATITHLHALMNAVQSRITEMSSKQWAQMSSVKEDHGEGLTADQVHEDGHKVATA